MPSKDIIHNSVKNALIKDGWVITAFLKIGKRFFYPSMRDSLILLF
ncbi:MAG: element excision factor XisH family protein [Cyanobacteria bacterium P01_A01_bin.68]